MRLSKAVQRVFQRTWRISLLFAFGLASMTALRAAVAAVMAPKNFGLVDAITAVFAGAVVGFLLGVFTGCLAKSHSDNVKSFQLDLFGFIGSVAGFLLGGCVGYVDRDGEFGWLPFNNDAILVGCIVGLFVGAILMAVVGEMLNPYRAPEPQASELD